MGAMQSRLACVVVLWAAGCSPSSGAGTEGEGSSSSSSSSSDSGATSSTGGSGCLSRAPDFMSLASSVRDGSVVMSVGPGPRFEVPQAWLKWQSEHANNLHLSRPELEAVRVGAGEWDTEYAEVLAEVLDFDRCSAHVGGEGWGAAAVSFGDLQLRVYVVEEPPSDIIERLNDTLMGDYVTEISLEMSQPWARAVLRWDNFYGDYGGPALVDLRLRRFEAATVVVAGMYSGKVELSNAELEAVVASICWSAGAGECC